MQRFCFAALCGFSVLSWFLGGCGGASADGAASTTVAPSVPNTPVTATGGAIDGRWHFLPYVTVSTGSLGGGTIPVVPGATFRGALATRGTQVTGAGQIGVALSSVGLVSCIQPQAVVLHGTFSASRHLSLTSDPVNGGGVLQMEADIPADPHQQSTGTTTLTGPCATSGTIHGQLYDAINGLFSGSVSGTDAATQQPATLGTASADLTETAPDASGQSVVSGTLTLALSSCTVHLPVNETRIGDLTGSNVLLGTATPTVLVSASADGSRLNALVSGLGQDCKPAVVALPIGQGLLNAGMTRQ